MSGRARTIVGLVVALVGLVWALQGFNVLGGSAMSGHPFWAVVGSFLVVIGAVVAWSGRRA
jgi:hypothetical protein